LAISTGVKPHTAYLVCGGQFLLTSGQVCQTATRRSATFTANLPMDGGALSALAGGSQTSASIIVNGSTLVQGELDNVSFDFTQRVITATGRDSSAKLHEMKSAEKWVNKKTTDIVQDLAQRAGLQAQVGEGMIKAGRILKDEYAKLTDGQSFASVIHKLAELDGARWFVKGTSLNYVSQGSSGGSYSLNYVPPTPGSPMISDCLHLTISYNAQAAKTNETTAKSWHSRKKKMLENTATVQGTGGKTTTSYHIPAFVQDQIQNFAKMRAQEMTRHTFHLEAEVVGDTSIDVSMSLQLSGTGPFDQQYQIDEIKHSFGMGGYTMIINAATAGEGRSAE
jgi:phage protein D